MARRNAATVGSAGNSLLTVTRDAFANSIYVYPFSGFSSDADPSEIPRKTGLPPAPLSNPPLRPYALQPTHPRAS